MSHPPQTRQRGLPVTRIRHLLSRLPTRLTVEQVSDVLAVPPPTVYRWLKDGEIPAYKVGSSWLILRDEVRDHLETRHNQSPST
jgi:excisionase family DNA binding protein